MLKVPHFLFTATACAALAGPLQAQAASINTAGTASTNAEASTEAPAADSDIVVTATRRDQAITSVPIAVTAVGRETIEQNAIRDTQDLTRVAPSLFISVAASESTNAVIRMRGVGTSGANLGLEGSVGVFVDGVYRARAGIALAELYDIDRVEVLRGAQGTLFGKNTTAGALIIRTRQPTYDLEADAQGTYQNRNGFRIAAAAGGPIVADKVAVRLAGVINKRDGFIQDAGTSGFGNNRDRFGVRGQIRLDPAPNVSIRTIVDYAEKNEFCCTATLVVTGARTPIIRSLGGFVPSDPQGYTGSTNFLQRSATKELGVSSQADIDFGDIRWSTILSYRNSKARRGGDGDDTNLDLLRIDFENTRDVFKTAETTLKGNIGPLDWLVGAFYFDQSTQRDTSLTFGADLARFYQAVFPAQAALLGPLYPVGGGATSRVLQQDAKGYSFFTHNILEVAPGLKVTGGIRWLTEKKTGSGVFVTSNTPACGRAGVPAGAQTLCPTPNYVAAFDDNAVVGTGSLSYEPTDRSLVYVTYARGYKAGGINLDPNAGFGLTGGLTFLPETVTSWEVGAKGRFLDNRLNLAVTLFHADYTNYQQASFNGQQTIISNAASVLSKGVEFEATVRPTQWVSFNSSVTYNTARYGQDTADAAVRGRQIVNAPEWLWQSQATIEQPLSDGLVGLVAANIRMVSDIATAVALNPQSEQDGYELVGGRVGIRSSDRRWQVALFAQNIFNVYYRQIVFAQSLQPGAFGAYLGEPRTYGIEARVRF